MSPQDTIQDLLGLSSAEEASPRPIFFDLKKNADQKKLQELFDKESVVIRDHLEEQLLELTIARHPSLLPLDSDFADALGKIRDKIVGTKPNAIAGTWVYLPWRRVLTHLLDEDEYFEIRTAYNREVITTKEQQQFRRSTLGIAGLSTGNNIALAIVLQGGSQRIRLADSDILELANMNRIRAGIDSIGDLKTIITAKQVYELDPFATLELFSQGITSENTDQFFGGKEPLDVLIDTVDNIVAKALIRISAKRHRVPVVSVINNGNDVLLDVERYDLDPKLEIFNGEMGDVNAKFFEKYDKMSPQTQVRLAAKLTSGRTREASENVLQEKMTPAEQARLLAQLMGPANIAPRLQDSFLMAGKHVYSWPQVSNTVLVSGGVAAFAARRIILGHALNSGRYKVAIEGLFDPHYEGESFQAERLKEMRKFLAVPEDD